jgi:hypothetical protein
VTPSAQAPAVHDTTPPTPRGRRWLIVATAGLAVVAMIAAALFSSRGHVPQATRGVRHQPVDTSIGDVAPVSLSNPRVRAEVNGSRVVFSWQKVAGATGYVWKSSTGRQGRTENDKVAIPKATSGKTCIVVQSTAPEAGLSDSSGAHACR